MGKKGKSENVQVILRLRPLNRKEKDAGMKDCVTANLPENCVYVDGAGVDGRAWGFDNVFTNAFSQKDVYLQVVHPVVETVLQGFNATIFAYGQSGTGKTFSMAGNLDVVEQQGIIPNALNHIFGTIEELQSDKIEYNVQVSYVELYNGKCRDLLVDGRTNLELKENAQKLFFVKDLTHHIVGDMRHAMELMESGLTRREVKATELNADSSRSHSLFTLHVRVHDKESDLRTESKLMLVDLAGSERQSKAQTSGESLKEGSNINLSLTALGTVIDCLVKAKPHIPYRSSPLTMLLKDGLGGNSRTLIVGTIGPTDASAVETVSTLRFIDRAKQIKNKPKVQMDPKDAKIVELQEENKKLRRQLGLDEEGSDVGDGDEEGIDMAKKSSKRVKLFDDELEELRRRNEELEVQVELSEQNLQAAQSDIAELRAKERMSTKETTERRKKLEEQINDMEDKQELDKLNDGESEEMLGELMHACTDFLATMDRDKVWIPTLEMCQPSELKDPQNYVQVGELHLVPTTEDILRGLRMLKGNGVDMRLIPMKRESFHIRHRASVVGGPIHGSPIQQVQSVSNNNDVATAVAAPAARQDREPHPPSHDASVDDLNGSRGYARVEQQQQQPQQQQPQQQQQQQQQHLQAPSSGLEGATAKKKKKKEDLTDKHISSVLDEAGINNDATRDAVMALLAKQKKILNDAQKARLHEAMAASGAAAMRSGGNADDIAELMATYESVANENEKYVATIAKQKTQVAKAKGVAEKKIDEINQLKEHINALREELAAKHSQHAAEIAMLQDRIVSQYNKRTEQLVAKHHKSLVKERKERDKVQEKVKKVQQQMAQIEQEYDIKIMEYESLQRDYEQLKIDNLRKFKEMGGFTTLGYPGSPVDQQTEKLRVAVSQDKNGRVARSAPEGPTGLGASSGGLAPLPSLAGNAAKTPSANNRDLSGKQYPF